MWGDINIHMDIHMNIDIHIINNMSRPQTPLRHPAGFLDMSFGKKVCFCSYLTFFVNMCNIGK